MLVQGEGSPHFTQGNDGAPGASPLCVAHCSPDPAPRGVCHGQGRAGALTSAVTVWSSLSPGHWPMACCLPELLRALSSACSTSKSFWCSEQAARCSDSSCRRDSGEGRAVEGQAHGDAEVCPAGTQSLGWARVGGC